MSSGCCQPVTSNIGDVAPATSASGPGTQEVTPPTAVGPTTPTPAATLQIHAKLSLQYVHHNEHRCHPLEPLQATLAQALVFYTDQLKAGSHHPGFLKRYRPGLSLTDELDDAMTWNAPGTMAKVLYP